MLRSWPKLSRPCVTSEDPPRRESGPLWDGAVSAFDRVRKFLADGEAVEARRHADADSRFKAAQARGSHTVPHRVRLALTQATKRLDVAKRSLTFLDSDFSRLPQRGDRQGLQRALGKLTHARAQPDLHRRVLERSAQVDPDDGKPLRAMAASLLAAAEPGAMAWLHHTPCHKVPSLTPSEFRAATRLTLCLDLPEIVQAVREETPYSCYGERFTTPALFAGHALYSKRRRPDRGGSVYAMHNCVAHTIQEFAGHAGIASFVGGGMCRAGTGPDGHLIHGTLPSRVLRQALSWATESWET